MGKPFVVCHRVSNPVLAVHKKRGVLIIQAVASGTAVGSCRAKAERNSSTHFSDRLLLLLHFCR
jgi:hypothetical protein